MKNKLLNFFKNLFGQKVSKPNVKINLDIEKPTAQLQELKKVIHSITMKNPNRTMAFKKQQLSGKILTLGKSNFRVKQRIGESYDKLKYQIEQL